MKYPIDLKQLNNRDLFKSYSNLFGFSPESFPELTELLADHKAEINKRLDAADSLALLEMARLTEEFFPGSFDLPIRKKITYSPTGQKAPAWLGFFSRKNKSMGTDS